MKQPRIGKANRKPGRASGREPVEGKEIAVPDAVHEALKVIHAQYGSDKVDSNWRPLDLSRLR